MSSGNEKQVTTFVEPLVEFEVVGCPFPLQSHFLESEGATHLSERFGEGAGDQFFPRSCGGSGDEPGKNSSVEVPP